jgi:hypothetical protein
MVAAIIINRRLRSESWREECVERTYLRQMWCRNPGLSLVINPRIGEIGAMYCDVEQNKVVLASHSSGKEHVSF